MYRRGLVKLDKEVVAEWIDGELQLKGLAKKIEQRIHTKLDEKNLRDQAA